MKKITLLAACFAVFTMNAQETLFEDSFEAYDDFAIESIGDWTLIDNDMDPTYGSADYDFASETYTGVATVFNPSLATADPAGTQTGTAADNANWVARTGDKGMYFFAGNGSVSGAPLNDDYFISPQIAVAGTGGSTVSFWAKSITDQFGLEQFEVLLSTTGNSQGDFTNDLSGGIVTAPIGDYVEFSYDISAFEGQNIYVAIHYVGADSFILLMDDFAVETTTLGVEDQSFNGFTQFVDADSNLRLSANTSMDNLQLFNVLGQQVVSQKLNSTNESVNISALKTGVYIASVTIEGQNKSFKIVKR